MLEMIDRINYLVSDCVHF